MRRKHGLLLCFFLLVIGQLTAQTIFTDRPTVATSPNTLPTSWFQIETGFQYQIRDADSFGNAAQGLKFENILFNGLLLRYGITDNFELRFNQSISQNRFRLDGETTLDDGVAFAPTSIGFKWRLLKDNDTWPDLAVLANYGNSVFTDFGGGATVDFSILFNTTIFKDVSFDYNVGVSYEDGFNLATLTWTFVLSKSLNDKLSGFFETYGSKTEALDPQFNIDLGFTYLISNTFQVDLYGGTGFSELSPNIMFGFGVSKLFLPTK